MRHYHTIPTVLEGDSLYEAFCRLTQYVKEIETASGEDKVSKSGDTMDGTLNFKGVNAGVTFTGDAANAKGIAGAIDTETGAGSLVIKGVKEPTEISDAATKGYVDAADAAIGESIDGIEEELEKKVGTAGGLITQGKLEFTGSLSGIKFNTASSQGIEGHISDQTGVGTTKITGIRNPVDPYDAATKEYVDEQIGSGKVSKTGDSMTGLLSLTGPQSGIRFSSGTSQGIIGAVSPVTGKGLTTITGIAEPLADYDVANKKYVDDATAGSEAKVSKSGDSMFGTLTFQENAEDPAASGIEFKSTSFGIKGWASPQTGNGLTAITNIRTPVNDYDAATKKYVDEHAGGGEGKVDKAGDSMTGTLNMTMHDIEQVGVLSGGQVNVTAGIIGEAAINELSLADATEYTAIEVKDDVYIEDANLSLGAGKLTFGRDSLGIAGYEHPS